ncbi:hypothetical protein OG223_41220 [Streptomyces sp. NBC_01478]|uniref:hypothetical protein n=1 Tax=Streptomyces sp. NBC_01478 TaxID=2903882 RepID=UPI002E33DF7A|nr:hypothetical protein [Streptomyces sp. NBC_01478]
MTRHEHPRPTPPSQAPGESGDPEARDEAEEAVRPRTPDDEAQEPSASGSAERRPSEQSTRAAPSDESDE